MDPDVDVLVVATGGPGQLPAHDPHEYLCHRLSPQSSALTGSSSVRPGHDVSTVRRATDRPRKVRPVNPDSGSPPSPPVEPPRRRRSHTSAWLVAAGLIVVAVGSHSAAAAPRPAVTGTALAGTDRRAQQVVGIVNVERLKHGCGPVTANGKLAAAAQAHSDDMAARDYYEHATPDGKDPGARLTSAGYPWTRWGENIAKGAKDPRAAMAAWMKSAAHRSTILNCAFKEIGVGVSMRPNGPWWTQDFAAR
ncbi:CAP domain-containing protein [Streptomyces sp. SID13666]|nr:CAP domain-containing protein [Streptomyces sp. SID13666]NEA75326.1 CAP domain-containing protein [Streptomyces sp. SID13588]